MWLQCNWEDDYQKQNIRSFQGFLVYRSLSKVYTLSEKNKLSCEYLRWQDGLLFTVLNSNSSVGLNSVFSSLPFCVQPNNTAELGDMGMVLPHSTRGPSPLIFRKHSDCWEAGLHWCTFKRALGFLWVVFKNSWKTQKCSRECFVFKRFSCRRWGGFWSRAVTDCCPAQPLSWVEHVF